MQTPTLGGVPISHPPNILDAEAPEPPQSEALAMEVETPFVSAQLEEVTDDSRSKKRKRTNSGEEREDTLLSRAVKKLKMGNKAIAIETFGFVSVPNVLSTTPARGAEIVIKGGKGEIRSYQRRC